MNENVRSGQGGWTIGQSIALELDICLSAAGGYFSMGALPKDVAELVRSLPPDWQEQRKRLLHESERLQSVLELAASLTDVFLEVDYSAVTLAIRELTLDAALARIADQASRYELAANADLPPNRRLVDLWMQLIVALYASVGIKVRPQDEFTYRLRQDMLRVTQILRDGDQHTQFWHWLDRFYYQFYRPWRETKAKDLELAEKRAIAALGAPGRASGSPDMTWLPEPSPLLRVPELQAAIQAGRFQVFFWVEPFGMADSWSLHPGWILLSFAEPGLLYDNFYAYAQDIARRAKALGDPTRLIILRMIRCFGMINTEIADALGLARPTVSVHAKILREAGMIHSEQDGRQVRHKIAPDEFRHLFHDIEQFLDLPDG